MTLAGNQFSALIDDLKSSHGRNLAAVILYGSAATGEFIPHASDYNILIALHEIRPRDLRAAQAPLREWQRMGHSLPIFFTVGELKDAADVFPIEFHQMEKARKVLYGADVLENLEVSDENLRHQTEYELRSKLIQLRRLYIPASASVANLVLLMIESLANFATLFRAVLLLHGVEPPLKKGDVIAATIRHLQLNREPFEKILALRADKNASNSLNEVSANELFASYMQEIEKVIEAVDKVRKS